MRARQFISAIFALWSRGGALQLAAIIFGFVGNPLLPRILTALQFFHELRRAYARTCGAVSPSLYGGTTEAHRKLLKRTDRQNPCNEIMSWWSASH